MDRIRRDLSSRNPREHAAVTVVRLISALALQAALVVALPAQEMLEQLEEKLNFSPAGGDFRLRLSGALDIEGYSFSNPVADLVSGKDDTFFNPRLTLSLDAQFGTRGYFFAQARVDRGFDAYYPGKKTEARLDEYALRYELSRPGSGRLFLQAGKFATVVGSWTKRHTAWENPFITAPLPYGNLTPLWDTTALPGTDTLLTWAHVRPVGSASAVLANKNMRLPIIWGPAYAQGAAVAGKWGRLEYAGEVKATGLSSRPERWNQSFDGQEHPTFSSRLGWRPDPSWNFGVSASTGEYLDRSFQSKIPTGLDRHDYRQIVIAHDVSFAWRHFQMWAEIYAARFKVPHVADLDTVAGYVEAKYRFAPRFSGAIRWSQQFFNHVTTSTGQSERWGRQTWRLDIAPSWRFTTQTQLKLQYSLQHEEPSREGLSEMLAAQLNVRF